jgi:hypothetical protein
LAVTATARIAVEDGAQAIGDGFDVLKGRRSVLKGSELIGRDASRTNDAGRMTVKSAAAPGHQLELLDWLKCARARAPNGDGVSSCRNRGL